MPVIRTKDDIYLEIPEGLAPDAPEVREAVQAERAGRAKRQFAEKMATPEMQAKQAASVAQGQIDADPTAGMGVMDKTLANIGAGMNAAFTGGKQLLGRGPSDDELRETRAQDAALSKSTDMGILPDWMPTAGSALQVAGEAAPAMIVPGGAAASGGRNVLARTLASMTRTPLRAGATGGAAAGALMPTTSDESRLMNTGIGAAAGASLPLAVKGYQAARGLTQKGAQEAAGRMMGVTDKSPLPADPAAMAIRGAENVPLSTAATYNDPGIAAMELTSRARGAATEGWNALDRGTRSAVWKNVEDATERAGTEGARRTERSLGWQEEAAKAFANAGPKKWAKERESFYNALQRLHRTPKGQGELRGVIYEIGRQMDEMGEGFKPEFLAEIRARMAGQIKGSPTDPFVSAPRSDPAFIALRDEIDAVLNRSTNNRWQRVKDRYAEESIPVAHAKAETAVRGSFLSPEGTPKVSVKEGVPDVTEAQLRRTLTGLEGKNKYGTAPTFAPDSGKVLKGTLQALQQQGITGAAKKTATGGGGSMTQPLAQAIARADASQTSSWIVRAAQLASHIGDGRALRELDEALIDPKRYYEIVQRTIAAGQPMSPGMKLALQAASTSAGGGLPLAMQAQAQ